ncbi:MAG: sterol desaturase family protein, partial [Cyanobacteria bacterium J06641_5]
GTFASERATLRPRYGLTHTFKSYNPVRVAFHEWNRLVRDLIAANTWRDRLRQIWELPAD